MAADEKKSIIQVRGKALFETGPCVLGFHNLIEADEYLGERKFNANFHFDEDGVVRLKDDIESLVTAPLWDEFEKTALAAGSPARKVKRPDRDEWVDDHLKLPGEKSFTPDPYIKFDQKEAFRNRQGDIVKREMGAWDIKGNILDLASLNIARKSVVQVILSPSLFMNALMSPRPSLKLVGIRILKLETFGRGGPSVGAIESEIEGLGADFEADDLSAFMKGAAGPSKVRQEPTFEDLDDEIPF